MPHNHHHHHSHDHSHKSKEERNAEREKRLQRKRESFMGYTNKDNPFGDSDLTTPFVWEKKGEKEKDKKDLFHWRLQKKKELEDLQRRKREREEEEKEREMLRMEEQRMKEIEQFGDWETREKKYLEEAVDTRSSLRIKEGRETPFDCLLKNILLYKGAKTLGNAEMELREPSVIIKALPFEELKSVRKEIDEYAKAHYDDDLSSRYFSALLLVCDDRIRELTSTEAVLGMELKPEIREQLNNLLEKKSDFELTNFKKELMRRIDNREGDTEFWECAVKEIDNRLSHSILKSIHTKLLTERLSQLEERKKHVMEHGMEAESEPSSDDETEIKRKEFDLTDDELDVSDAKYDCMARIRSFESVSPLLVPVEAVNVDPFSLSSRVIKTKDHMQYKLVDPVEDWDEILRKRSQVKDVGIQPVLTPTTAHEITGDDEFVASGLGEISEENMKEQDEVIVDQQSYAWLSKYKPRKPKYLNKVKTGFIWSKYNQSHYDKENPPPKQVQGYKFNIFYPDLIDPRQTPTFKLIPDKDPTFVIIKFHAGPPYEDIAFRIMNQVWNIEPRQGYKAVFSNGILQLYFNFKRLFYRR